MSTNKNTQTKSETQGKTSPVGTFRDREVSGMLVKGEEIILRANLHGAIYWKSVAVLLIAVLLLFFVPPLGILFAIFGALMLCLAILTQHYLLLMVTNKRVLARYGLLQMDVVDIRLSKIESIDLERMLPGHIFGYASVVVMGTGQRMLRVPFISNAEEFRRYYNEMVLAQEGDEDAEEEIGRVKETVEKQKRDPSRR